MKFMKYEIYKIYEKYGYKVLKESLQIFRMCADIYRR